MAQSTREKRRERRPQREMSDEVEETTDDVREKGSDEGGGAFSELKSVMSEAAVSVLAPVAKKVVTQGAKMAVERGPELLEDTVLPKLQDAGDKVGGLFGGGDDEDDKKKGGAGDGTGKGRRMPIQQSVDVAAPLDVVYDQFTQFEDFPRFMHRVERVEQRDEAHVVFTEKMWGVRRQWEAEIIEQIPDERIVWKTTSGMNHVGVVTFHELSDRLTRVMLNLDLDPDGLLEKVARGGRFVKRAARADLKRFKAFVEMHDEETGQWRGEIEDGEVVGYDEPEDEGYEDEEPEAVAEDEEPEAAEDDDEPEASEDEDYEEQDEQEEEDDDEPSRRATAKSKANGGRAKSKTTSASRSRSRSRSSSGAKSQSQSRAKAKAKPKAKSQSNGRRTTRSKATSGKR